MRWILTYITMLYLCSILISENAELAMILSVLGLLVARHLSKTIIK